MNRTTVNPWSWSTPLGFDQGHVVEDHRRTLFASGQDSVDESGNVVHAGDMAAQVAMALSNLESVLRGASMGLGDVVRLNVYCTDVDGLLDHWSLIVERFRGADARFVTSVLGVTRLAAPDLLVLLEATAVA